MHSGRTVEGPYRHLNFVLESIPGGGTVVVVGITGSKALMVQRNSIIESTVEAWAASKMLLHRRQRAGTARKISVSTNGAGAGREVMIEGIMSAATSARVRVARSRAEGRCAGVGTAMRGNATVVVGGLLPVDGLETLVELLGARELPLAENGPEDGDAAEGGSDCDEDRRSRASVFIGARGGGGQRCSLSIGGLINRCSASDRGYYGAGRRDWGFRKVKGWGSLDRGC